MDLETGDTIYVEALVGRAIRLTVDTKRAVLAAGATTRLTTDEARTLANALLAAVAEAEAHATR